MRGKILIFGLTLLGLGGSLGAEISMKEESVNGEPCRVIGWADSKGQPRSLFLNTKNPGALRMTYRVDGALVTNNAGSEGHFIGELVDHGSKGATTSGKGAKNVATKIVLAGRHHAIFRYTFELPMNSEPGHNWRISEDWEFIDGRDSFLQTVAYDSSEIPADTKMADDLRGPYNQTDWTGGGNVSRVAWGNDFKFQTTGNFSPNPVTCTYSCSGKAAWDWSEPNTIPYVWEWCDPRLGAAVDREWGIVQNLPDSVQDFGGAYYAVGNMPAKLPAKSGKDNLMFECWAAPTQMNCYDSAWNSGRITWGATYATFNNGHSNDRNTQVMGNIFRPVAGWSWLHLVAKYSDKGFPKLVKDNENIFKSTLSATQGSVVTEGPVGPGDNVGPGVGKQLKKGVMPTMSYPHPGFDHIYRTWNIRADKGGAHGTLNVSGSLERPSFVILGVSKSPCLLRLNGAVQIENKDFFSDADPAGGRLWVTFVKTLGEGPNNLEIDTVCGVDAVKP